MEFALLGFGLAWDWGLNPLFLLVSPFWNGNVYICLSHQYILEAGYLLSRFTPCKHLQRAVIASLGRDKWRIETLGD